MPQLSSVLHLFYFFVLHLLFGIERVLSLYFVQLNIYCVAECCGGGKNELSVDPALQKLCLLG